MKKFNDYLREQMQNPELKKEYDNLQPEFDIIRAIVDARTSQNLTQKQLAEKNIPVVLIDCGFLLTNCGINPTRFHVDESH